MTGAAARRDRRRGAPPLALAALLLAPVALAGLLLLPQLQRALGENGWAPFAMLYIAQDRPVAPVWALLALGLAAITLVAGLLAGRRAARRAARGEEGASGIRAPGPAPLIPLRAAPPLVFALGFLPGLAGAIFAHHGFAMSMDEAIPIFQARIFLEGHLAAPLPPEMAPHAEALQPLFVRAPEGAGLWFSDYRPVHALLIAPFLALGAEAALNPILAGIGAVAVWAVIRRLRPGAPDAALLAAAAMALAPQAAATAASQFAYTAHASFNAVWLLLLISPGRAAWAGAALTGFLACGLHQVHPHALFAAPLLLALLLRGGDGARRALSLGALYLIWLPFWMGWPEWAVLWESGDWRSLPANWRDWSWPKGFLFTPRAERDASQIEPDRAAAAALNGLRFLLWLGPGLAAAALAGALRPWRLRWMEAGCLAALALMIAFRFRVSPDQIHGWGYRYFHPGLPLIAVLAGAALAQAQAAGPRAAAQGRALALAGLAATALLLTPWRLQQVEAKVGPRAAAAAHVAALDADIALIEAERIWFGLDLVRNDPFLRNRPLVLSAPDLEGGFPGLDGAARVGPEALRPYGIATNAPLEPDIDRGAAAR